MAAALAIFYTGDVRHNQHLRRQNHQKLFDKLGTVIEYKVYEFTRDDPNRGICPYDPPINMYPDTSYRRGQGGAVQVWDFLRGVQRTQESLVMKLRTDLYFTDHSIDLIFRELQELLAYRSDISFFGSDWRKENAGAIDDRREINFVENTFFSDFVVLARRERLKPFDQTVADINQTNFVNRRDGNAMFRSIIPTSKFKHKNVQNAKVFGIFCQIWLIRKHYTQDPGDITVCRDYIQSYFNWGNNIQNSIANDEFKEMFRVRMQPAVDWWRQAQGMKPKLIDKDRCTEWQLP